SMIKKIGVKSFCDEYRRELTTGENVVVTGANQRPEPRPEPSPTGYVGQTGNDWAADCRVTDKESARYVSCLRYARGVADGFILAQMFDENVAKNRSIAPTSIICIPLLATSNELVEVALSYWNTANSETRNLRASQFLTEAWLKKWQCPKERTSKQ